MRMQPRQSLEVLCRSLGIGSDGPPRDAVRDAARRHVTRPPDGRQAVLHGPRATSRPRASPRLSRCRGHPPALPHLRRGGKPRTEWRSRSHKKRFDGCVMKRVAGSQPWFQALQSEKGSRTYVYAEFSQKGFQVAHSDGFESNLVTILVDSQSTTHEKVRKSRSAAA